MAKDVETILYLIRKKMKKKVAKGLQRAENDVSEVGHSLPAPTNLRHCQHKPSDPTPTRHVVRGLLMIFWFTFVTFNQQTADLEKKSYSLE